MTIADHTVCCGIRSAKKPPPDPPPLEERTITFFVYFYGLVFAPQTPIIGNLVQWKHPHFL